VVVGVGDVEVKGPDKVLRIGHLRIEEAVLNQREVKHGGARRAFVVARAARARNEGGGEPAVAALRPAETNAKEKEKQTQFI